MSHFAGASAGDATALVSDDLVLLTLLPRMAFPQYITALALPLAMAPFLFAVDWRLALVALAPVPLALPMLGQCRKALDRGMRRRNAAMVAVGSMVIEYVKGMEVVKGFRLTFSPT
jgi:ATP-binding cassette subfamily B protein